MTIDDDPLDPAPGDSVEGVIEPSGAAEADPPDRALVVTPTAPPASDSATAEPAGEPIIKFLRSPLPLEQALVYTGIGDPFSIRIRIAIITGIILAMPVLLWHVWRFIAPGLTAPERRAILPWIPAALLFFVVGVSIAYVILPFAAAFLLAFQTPDLQPLLTAREYFDFVSTLFLAFGLLMEFPILLVGLSRVGIVTSERLRRSRRLIVLVIAVFSAVATPGGDLVSPAVLGITLYILFEGTIVVIRRSGR